MKVQRRRLLDNPSCFAVAVGVSLLALSGCGGGSGSSSDRISTYTLSSGAYRVSGSSAVPPDNCNLADDVPNAMTVRISVSENNATFSFETAPDPSRDPVLTIQGNTLEAGSKTYDKDNNANPPDEPSFDCVETITVTLSGRITGQNQLQATIDQSSTRRSGTQCARLVPLHYKAHPCLSTLSFTATKI